MNSEKRKKDVLTAQKFDIFYIYFYISSKNFYFIGNLTANNYDKEFEKLQYKIHLLELKLKKKRISFWSIILISVPLKYFLPHSELKFLELAEPLLIQITFKHRMTLLFHEWLTHWEFRVLVICFAFFFFRNVNPAIPKISKFSSAKEFKFPPVAHLDKKIKVSGTSSQLVCPLIYTPVYKLARMLISQDLQVGRKLYR